MKDKLINIVLIIIAIFAPIIYVPKNEFIGTYMLKNVFLLTCGFLLLLLILANYKKLKFDLKDFLLLAFIILIIISGFLSTNFHNFIFGEYTRYEGFLMFLTYACIYLASKKFFKYENMARFLNIMFYVSMAIGLFGLFQTYHDVPTFIFNRIAISTFGNPDFFGSFISIVLPISMSIYVLYNQKKALVLSSLMFFNMLSCGTRSSWLAFGIVIILSLIFLLSQKKKAFWLRTSILVICFILIFIFIYNNLGNGILGAIFNLDFSNLFNPSFEHSNMYKKFIAISDDISLLSSDGLSGGMGSGRITIWILVLNVIEKYPLLGCGPDNLALGLAQSCPYDFIEYTNIHHGLLDKAHNEYLHIAATIGIPALIIYLVFLALITIPKLKNISKDNKAMIFSVAILSYLIQAFFNISTIGVAPLFWMLLGLIDNTNINKNNLLCERGNVNNEQNEKKNI